MNRLPIEERVRILSALVEGNSIRGTSRMTGAAKGTILKLLADVGDACDLYQDQTMQNLRCVRVQLDEIWSYCHAKQRNLVPEMRGKAGVGDMWTWTAIDADSKLILSWHLGKRTRADAQIFIRDLAKRITSNVQISTDGFNQYVAPIQRYFKYRADHGTEIKVYGFPKAEDTEARYSPQVVLETKRKQVWGAPDPDFISTAYVERNNLTMRMSMRRFTRLTNAFSKKQQNLQRALALHFMHYNFCRKHQTLKTTPAIKAGLTDRTWTLHDLANLPDVMRDSVAA
jgi:IS1 family transposase